MARRLKKSSSNRRSMVFGSIILLMAMLVLVSLVSHEQLDDTRIKGEIDNNLNPFEMKFRNQGGMLGAYLSYSLTVILGWLAYFIPLGLILISARLFTSELGRKLELNSFLLFIIALTGTVIYNIHLLVSPTIGFETGALGGYITVNLSGLSLKLVGELGSYIVASGLIIILLIAYTSVTPILSAHLKLPGSQFFKKTFNLAGKGMKTAFSFKWLFNWDADNSNDEESDQYADGEVCYEDANEQDEIIHSDQGNHNISTDSRGNRSGSNNNKRKTTLKKSAEPVQIKSIEYSYPSVDLLEEPVQSVGGVSSDELRMTARMLKETLETFGISVDGAIESYPGPIITRFEFKPGSGIKVNRIISLADDLALALKARRIRIVAPIPGKAAVGVEIPNRSSQLVYLRDIVNSEEFANRKLLLPLALGKDIAGRSVVTDLAKMPHLLIAGATGSGKSVCMNALITSLMYRMHPLHIRFIFIDPKMLELSVYSGIPHLGRPVVTSPKRAEKVLGDIVAEMERRYRKLAGCSVRNIEDFNNRQKNEEDKLPYIVVFVDELADLMIAATSSKIEMLITRLAQMARAVGIHLILATQRPSVDVITGLIKANFPARIAFQVASKVDSRTIIDQNGAEKLLGSGDMLFLNSGQPEPVRIHGAFLSNDETEQLVKFITDQGLEMMALEGISQASGDNVEAEIDLGDPLFKEACEVVIRHKQGSVSLLQRRLGIGYQRAARLIDKLEKAGIVSPFDGSKAREVMVDQSYLEILFSENPNKLSDQPG